MCTVTYIPGPAGFILTHNRDEAPQRSSKSIVRMQMEHGALVFPRDALAGGSWIGVSERGPAGSFAACLLNGAFERHERRPPYRRSRGLILLDCLSAPAPESFLETIDLDNIEPFTLLLFHAGNILELRWDGQQKYFRQPAADVPQFWCSATLYDAGLRVRREQVFREWLTLPPHPPTPQSMLYLHLTGSIGDPANDFVMNRDGRVQTVSVTQLVLGAAQGQMEYFDLLDGISDTQALQFSELLPA